MTKGKRIELIIDYAKKVLQYPKGSAGYDPVDAMNLKDNIEKYEAEQAEIAMGVECDAFYKATNNDNDGESK